MKRHYKLLIILMFAAALRLFLALTCDAKPDYSDMALYNKLAMEGPLTISPPPGYPLFLRLVYTFFGAYNYKAVFVIQSVLSVLSVYLIYRVARALGNEMSALIAAGIAAVYPNFLFYNLTTLSESMSILIVAILLVVLVSELSDTRRAIFAALALCFGFFVRPALIFFLPGALLSVRRRVIFAAVSILILAPWFIFGAVSDRGSNRGALGFYKSYNPKATGIKHYKIKDTDLQSRELPSKKYVTEALDFIKNNKWKSLDIIYNKASLLISRGWDSFVFRDIVGDNKNLQQILEYAYLPIMLLGFIGMIRLYDQRTRAIALPTISYFALIVLVWIFKYRYRVLIEPTLIVFASLQLEKGLRSIRLPRFHAARQTS